VVSSAACGGALATLVLVPLLLRIFLFSISMERYKKDVVSIQYMPF
jgi:hypothetical protein